MSAPQRIQLRRTKGWRKPEGCIVVARPSRWGNPFIVCDELSAESAVEMYRSEVTAALRDPWGEPHPIGFRIIAESLPELRGRDLACWCGRLKPCHADVLLELANA